MFERRGIIRAGLLGLAIAGTAWAGDPYARAGYRAIYTEPGALNAKGSATIVDERTIQIDHFSYDGTAPLVYLYLGVSNSQADLVAGIPIGPLLDRAYIDESIIVQLPTGESLDGYGGLSVWCVQFFVDFGSGLFTRSGVDFDIDGDADDVDHFVTCATGPALGPPAPGCVGCGPGPRRRH